MKIISCIMIALVLSSCLNKNDQLATGIIDGNISIGPLCPVETNPPNPDCQPTRETFNAYSVAVYDAKHQEVKAIINPTVPDGFFSIEMTEGEYVVDFEKPEEHQFGMTNLPMPVTVVPNGKVSLSINIDTGIR